MKNEESIYVTSVFTAPTYSAACRMIYERVIPVGGVVRFLVDDQPIEGEVHLPRREYIVLEGGTMALLEEADEGGVIVPLEETKDE